MHVPVLVVVFDFRTFLKRTLENKWLPEKSEWLRLLNRNAGTESADN